MCITTYIYLCISIMNDPGFTHRATRRSLAPCATPAAGDGAISRGGLVKPDINGFIMGKPIGKCENHGKTMGKP